MELHKMKLGEVLDKKEIDGLVNIMKGTPRLMKITYTFQNEHGTELSLSACHKDYKDPEDEED